MTDERVLIAKAKDGDREALNSITVNYWNDIYRLVMYKISNEDDAKELTQETFMKAFRSLPNYQLRDASFKTYLGRIAINLVNDYWRKKGRIPQIIDITEYQKPIVDGDANPEDYALKVEQQQEIVSMVQSLPEEQRQALKLRIISGVSVRDTAKIMGKTDSAIKMLQQRALKNLRKMCIDSGVI